MLPVKNTGNTIDAVTGNVSVKDARGTRNLTVQAVKILPGKTVNIPLGTKLDQGLGDREGHAQPERASGRCRSRRSSR